MSDMIGANRLSQHLLSTVGDGVRSRRKAQAMTVQQLADSAGLSRRMVTQIELGQANASLTTIDRLAAALGVDFSTLVREPQLRPVHVISEVSSGREWRSDSDGVLVFHSATSIRPAAELWEGTLPPDARLDSRADPPGSQVLLFVYAGTLTVEVDAEPSVDVAPGASAVLHSELPHSYVNRGAVPTRFVRVFQIGRVEEA